MMPVMLKLLLTNLAYVDQNGSTTNLTERERIALFETEQLYQRLVISAQSGCCEQAYALYQRVEREAREIYLLVEQRHNESTHQ